MIIREADKFIRMLEAGIKHHIGKVMEEHIVEAQKSIRAAIEGEADKLALSLLQEYDVERNGKNIVITVRKS